MQELIFINGDGKEIELTDALKGGNYGITNWEGLGNVGLNLQTQQVPFVDGAVFIDGLLDQREISLTVAIKDDNDLHLRYELKRHLISVLNPKTNEGTLIYKNDYLEKKIKAIPQTPIFENKNSNDAGTLKANVVFSCPNPYWEDLIESAESVVLGEMGTIENEGDIETQVKISLTGNAINPTITNLDTNKKIGYNGGINGKLEFNTLNGQKGIHETKITFEQINGIIPIRSMVYVKGYYYLLDSNNSVLRSTNLIDFETIILNESNALLKIKYFENFGFFILGNNGALLRSQDGVNWTKVTSFTVNTLEDIATDGTRLMICGSNQVWISTDGNNWSSVTVGTGGNKYIAYGNGVWVVMGLSWWCSSNNGANWSKQMDVSVNSLQFLNGYFFVTGSTGLCWIFTDGTLNTLSSNGIGTTDNLSGVLYDGHIFIVYGQESGKTAFFTNQNAVTGTVWNKVLSNESIQLGGVAFTPELGIFTGFSGNGGAMHRSIDLQNWETVWAGIPQSLYLRSIAYSKKLNLYVCLGTYDYKGYIATSTDKKNWNVQRASDDYVRKVIWSEDLEMFIIGASSIMYSYNGTQWTKASGTSGQTGIINEIIKVGNEYIVINQGGTKISRSTNGINWTITSTDITEGTYITGLCYNAIKQTYYAVLHDKIYKSTNLTHWELLFAVSTGNLNKIIYNPILKIMIAVGDKIVRSADGENWEEIDNPLTSFLYGIDFSDDMNLFIAGGTGIITSADGRNWEINKYKIPVSEVKYIESLNQIFTVGGYNVIFESAYYKINKIENMQINSDVGFNLKRGSNRIMLSCEQGTFQIVIKYTQRYIGV